MSEHYDVLAWEKFRFLVTPRELRNVLDGVHHVVVNTGVKKGYTESPPEEFYKAYEDLYDKLKKGDKLVWKNDYKSVSIQTGLTGYLDNCRYNPSTKLSVPDFLEPCAILEPFCFFMYRQQLSASFYIGQFPENTVGLCLMFPKKTEFSRGIVPSEELADHKTYRMIIDRVRSVTKPLKLLLGDKIYRPAVRISEQAKADLQSFYFIRENNAKL